MNRVKQDPSIYDNTLFCFRERLAGILFLSGIFFLNFLARFIWSPLLVVIEKDFSIRHTEAGGLFLMISIGYFTGLSISGHVSSRFNHQKTVIFSCFSCGTAVIGAMLAPSMIFLYMALVGIGFTAGLYLPTGIALLTYRLNVNDFGKAFAFHEMAPSLGFIAGPLLAEAFLGWSSWHMVLIPITVGLVVAGIGYNSRSWSGDYSGEPISVKNIRLVASRPAFWFMMLPFFFGIGANVGVFSILPLYLQTERGMDQSVANIMLSASRVAAMFSVLVSGWATTRFSTRAVVVLIFAGTGLFTALLGVAPARLLWVPIFIQPLLATAFFPPAFSILSQIFSPQYRNLAVGLLTPVGMVVGAGLIPTMISVFGDAGRFHTGFTITGILSMSCTAFLFMVRAQDKSQVL